MHDENFAIDAFVHDIRLVYLETLFVRHREIVLSAFQPHQKGR